MRLGLGILLVALATHAEELRYDSVGDWRQWQVPSGDPFEASGEETLKTMALVWGCYHASEELRVVKPDELLREAKGTRSS